MLLKNNKQIKTYSEVMFMYKSKLLQLIVKECKTKLIRWTNFAVTVKIGLVKTL